MCPQGNEHCENENCTCDPCTCTEEQCCAHEYDSDGKIV